MSRSIVILVVVLLLLAGGLFYLSGRDATQAPVTVEKVVPLENLSN